MSHPPLTSRRTLLVLALAAATGSAAALSVAAAAPTTAPAAAPATRPTTRRAPVPTDRPAMKYDRKGQPDAYFMGKHDAFLARGKAGPIGVLFLGDSITDFWTRAPQTWKEHYGAMQPANFGVSGDRTEHVLWRIDHGELDGIHPKVVVLLIGTNNSGDTVAHVTAGTDKVVSEIRHKLPDAKLLLLAIFPRGATPTAAGVAATRAKLTKVNQSLAKLDDGTRIRYLDIGDKFLAPDGSIPKDVMSDGLHPTPKGYQIWTDAMQPLLDEMMK